MSEPSNDKLLLQSMIVENRELKEGMQFLMNALEGLAVKVNSLAITQKAAIQLLEEQKYIDKDALHKRGQELYSKMLEDITKTQNTPNLIVTK